MPWRLLWCAGAWLAASIAVAAPVVAQPSPTPAPPRAVAAGASDAELAAFFDDFVARGVDEHEFPGVSLVVVRDGRTVLAKGYGVADFATGRAMSPDGTVLEQGSIGKLLTWILVLQLVEAGRLDLDADIAPHLDFAVPRAFGRPVTMRHLMTHTAGFSQPLAMVAPAAREAPLRDRLAASLPVQAYAPGDVVAYSNHGAALAAHVVERLEGARWEDLVRTRILAPLGMHDASVEQPPPAPLRARLAPTYGALSRTPRPPGHVPLPPAGSLAATQADMAKLLRALMPGAPGPRLLRDDTLAAMRAMQRELADGADAGLGLGLLVGRVRGVAYAGHGGTMPGAATDLEFLPDHGVGWVIAINGRGREGAAVPFRQQLLRAAIARFHATAPIPAAAPATPAILASARDAAGDYVPTRRGHVGIARLLQLATTRIDAGADGTLRVTHEGTPLQFVPQARDRWIEPDTGLPLVLVRDADGRAVRFASPRINAVTLFERAPRHVPVARVVALAAPAVLLLALLATPVAAFVRARRRRRFGAKRPRRPLVVRAAFWLVVLTATAWSAVIVATALEPGTPAKLGVAYLALAGFAIASVPASAVLAWDAVAAWRARGGVARLSTMLVAAAAVAMAWLYVAYGFTTTTTIF